LIIAEVAVFWKVEDGLFFIDFVIFIVEHLNDALSDKVHLLNITFVANYSFVRRSDTTIHIDDKFISEAALTLFEEVTELSLKVPEESSALYQISLHLRSDLLVELEFLNNEIEIVIESLLDILSDIIVQSRIDVVRLI
jgi:hypothetical protein